MPRTPLAAATTLAVVFATSAPAQHAEAANLLRRLGSNDQAEARAAAEALLRLPSAQPFVLGVIVGSPYGGFMAEPALALDSATAPPRAAAVIAAALAARPRCSESCLSALEGLGPVALPALPSIEAILTRLRAERGPRDRDWLQATPRLEALAKALRALPAAPPAPPAVADISFSSSAEAWSAFEGHDAERRWLGLCHLLADGSESAFPAALELVARATDDGPLADLAGAIHVFARGRALGDLAAVASLHDDALARELRWYVLSRPFLQEDALRTWFGSKDPRVRAAALLAYHFGPFAPPPEAIDDPSPEVQAVVAAIRAHHVVQPPASYAEVRLDSPAFYPAAQLAPFVDEALRDLRAPTAGEVLIQCGPAATGPLLASLADAAPDGSRLDVALALAPNDARTLGYALRCIEARRLPRRPAVLGEGLDGDGARRLAARLSDGAARTDALELVRRAGPFADTALDELAPALLESFRTAEGTGARRAAGWAIAAAIGDGHDDRWSRLLADPLAGLRALALTARPWTFEGSQAASVPRVLELARDPDPAVATAAHRLLPAAIGPTRAVAHWAANWQEMSESARAAALQLVVAEGAGDFAADIDALLPLCLGELRAESPALRCAASFAFATVSPADPRVAPSLEALFTADDPQLLRMALGTLPAEFTDRLWPLAIAAVRHEDPTILALVPRVLERASTDAQRVEATAALLGLVGHAERSVQWRAQSALIRIGVVEGRRR